MIRSGLVQWKDYYDDAERYDAEVSFLQRDVEWYLGKVTTRYRKVLVCGCGTGRLVLPLAEAGLDVCGIDRSGPMLERARQKLQAMPEDIKKKVKLVQADMRRFNLDDSFDCAIIPFNCVGHLHDEAQVLATFESVHAHLNAAGTLLLDFTRPVPELLSDYGWGQPVATRRLVAGSRTLVQYESHRFHPERRISETVFTFLPEVGSSGAGYRCRLELRVFEEEEIVRMVRQAGFEVVRTGLFSSDLNGRSTAGALDAVVTVEAAAKII